MSNENIDEAQNTVLRAAGTRHGGGSMRRFEIGRSYGVLHCDERDEVVTVVDRSDDSVTLADGRKVRILPGVAPDGSDEEVLRIDERGAVAFGGVVRVCHSGEPRREAASA